MLIDQKTEEKYYYKGKSDANGNYKIEIKNTIKIGVDYKVKY